MSGSQQVCRSRVRSARKPKDFSRIAEPTSSPSRSRPSVQIPRVLRPLDIRQGADEVHLDLGREFLGDLLLRAPQNKRGELRAQAGQVPSRSALSDASNDEREPRSPRQKEAENAPEIELAVLQRRAGENDPVARTDGEAGLRHLGVRVLDELALVQDGVGKVGVVEKGAVLPQLRVAAEPDDGILAGNEVVAGLQDVDRHRREELRISSRQTGTTLAGHT